MNKTKAELEKSLRSETMFGWVMFILVMCLAFFIVILSVNGTDLKSQLAECQDELSVKSLIELKHLAFTGSNLRLYIDGMEVINHNGTVSFWVKVLKQNLPFGEVHVWNRTIELNDCQKKEKLFDERVGIGWDRALTEEEIRIINLKDCEVLP